MKKKDPNFIFFGTPDVASGTLEILKQNGYVPSLIVTSPDARSGRKMLLNPPPVKTWAESNGIPCLQPEKLDSEFYNKLKPSCLEPNCLFIVVAYGKIMPKNLIELPKLGSINIHYSLLPKYRGASPVESAILNGETETGVSIQQMTYEMDSGPILAKEKTPIYPDEKAPELRSRLIKQGGELLVKLLQAHSASAEESPLVQGEKQDESKATYCKKIKKEDGLINLNDNAIVNYNKFRAYAAWPRVFFIKNGKRVIVTDAELADEARDKQFIIKKVLPEGKKEMKYEEFLRISN